MASSNASVVARNVYTPELSLAYCTGTSRDAILNDTYLLTCIRVTTWNCRVSIPLIPYRTIDGLLRGAVVRTLVFGRRTFLSHARPATDG